MHRIGRRIALSAGAVSLLFGISTRAEAVDPPKIISPNEGQVLLCNVAKLHIDVEPNPDTKLFEVMVAPNSGIGIRKYSNLKLSQGVGSQWDLKDFPIGEEYQINVRWYLSGAPWSKTRHFKVEIGGVLPGQGKPVDILQPILGQHFKVGVGPTFRGEPHPTCPLLPVTLEITGPGGVPKINLLLSGDAFEKGWTYKTPLFKAGAYKVRARWQQTGAELGPERAFFLD